MTNSAVALSESVLQGHIKEFSKTISKGSLLVCGFTPRAALIYENEAPNVNVVSYSPIPEF